MTKISFNLLARLILLLLINLNVLLDVFLISSKNVWREQLCAMTLLSLFLVHSQSEINKIFLHQIFDKTTKKES